MSTEYPMQLVVPLVIDDSVYTDSDVPETDHAAWSAATDYNVGDYVIRTQTHRIYRNAAGGVDATPPEDALTGETPRWVDMGATNRWRVFDQRLARATAQEDEINLELTPGAVVDSLCLFGLAGRSVQVVMTDPGDGVVYDQTFVIFGPAATNWWQYFFGPFTFRTELIISSLPAYANAVITVRVLADEGEQAEIGELVLGRARVLGCMAWGSSMGIIDSSRKDRDEFLAAFLVEGDFADRIDYDVEIDTVRVREVKRLLSQYRATAVVWVGTTAFDGLGTVVYGFFNDFNIVLAGPVKCQCSIYVEGLT